MSQQNIQPVQPVYNTASTHREEVVPTSAPTSVPTSVPTTNFRTEGHGNEHYEAREDKDHENEHHGLLDKIIHPHGHKDERDGEEPDTVVSKVFKGMTPEVDFVGVDGKEHKVDTSLSTPYHW